MEQKKMIIAGILILIIICIVIFVIYKINQSKSTSNPNSVNSSTTPNSTTPNSTTPNSTTPNSNLGVNANNTVFLIPEYYLARGGSLISPKMKYSLVLDNAGNLYTQENSTGTVNFTFYSAHSVEVICTYLKIDSKGFLNCYDNNMNVILKVNKYPGGVSAALIMQDDGNLVLYILPSQKVVWSSAYGDTAPS